MCLFTSSLSFLLQLINKPELVTTNLVNVAVCRHNIPSSIEQCWGAWCGVFMLLLCLIYSNKLGGIFIDLPRERGEKLYGGKVLFLVFLLQLLYAIWLNLHDSAITPVKSISSCADDGQVNKWRALTVLTLTKASEREEIYFDDKYLLIVHFPAFFPILFFFSVSFSICSK